MFPNIGPDSGNYNKHNIYNQHPIRHVAFGNRNYNPNPAKKRMEKLILNVLIGTGFGTYIAGILLNVGTLKGDVLFVLGALFMLMKFVRLMLRTWQAYKREELEQKILKKKADE